MSPVVVKLYALIGLRALAGYDQDEVRRATDLSKGEIDRSIRALLEETGMHVRESQDIIERLEELHRIEADAETEVESAYLLRQVSISSLQKAQQLALRFTRGEYIRPSQRASSRGLSSFRGQLRAEKGLNIARLAGMRLLRDIPEYDPKFEYLVRNRRLDLLLQPHYEGWPVVLIEVKDQLRSPEQLAQARNQLRAASTGWGGKAIAAIVTTLIEPSARSRISPDDPHILVYDPETNEFLEGAEALRERVMVEIRRAAR